MAKTNEQIILNALQRRKTGISGWYVFDKLRLVHYTKPISNLRKQGWNILSEWRQSKNGKRYINYTLA